MIKISRTLIALLLVVCMSPLSVFAKSEFNSTDTSITVGYTTEEKAKIKKIYKELFPEQYHYIEEATSSRSISKVSEIKKTRPIVVFEQTKQYNNENYTLKVYDNGVCLVTYSETLNVEPVLLETDSVSTRSQQVYTKKFTTGDLSIGDICEFIVTYTIDNSGYDHINSYDFGRCTYTLYPISRRYKQWENSSGNAYIAYHAVDSTNSTVRYDLGVAVGDNDASGYSQISTSLWSFLMYMLDPWW